MIGDHTEVHAAYVEALAPPSSGRQLLEQASAIERYGATFPRLFRPPYGLVECEHAGAAAPATGC